MLGSAELFSNFIYLVELDEWLGFKVALGERLVIRSARILRFKSAESVNFGVR